MSKPILCLDFDGTLHDWRGRGFRGMGDVEGPPTDGAMWFLNGAVENFTVAVFSTRSGYPEGLEAMQRWLRMNLRLEWGNQLGGAIYNQIQWPTSKPPAWLTIDDRAITFRGEWPEITELLKFRAWDAPDRPF